jgi:metallo-beta-lactamase family protein
LNLIIFFQPSGHHFCQPAKFDISRSMKISFHGAARTVTGSKHLVRLQDGRNILLDCGMFQGLGKDTLAMNRYWGFDPAEITYVIISHAHIDHTGLLPRLVKAGYSGPIFCTPATADLMHIMLLDSAHVQEADTRFINSRRRKANRAEEEPLYTEEDVMAVFPLLVTVPYNKVQLIGEDVELLFTDCGHILGSAAINLRLREGGESTRITFSGDVGRYRDMILRSPDTFPQADIIMLESTYGDQRHDVVSEAAEQLLTHIRTTCLERKGRLIIPAFSIGRTQELLFILNRLELEGRLPALPYYVDSPLSAKSTNIIKAHPECFNRRVQQLLTKDADVFSFSGLKFIQGVEESMALNDTQEPCVIISASGMAEAGRVKHHIAHAVGSARNTILITGYCEPQSLGARLQEARSEVSIFGRRYPQRAEVATIKTLSAHGDYEDISQWLACQDPAGVRKIFLVHGEYAVQQSFRARLMRKGFRDVYIPALHEEVGLGQPVF